MIIQYIKNFSERIKRINKKNKSTAQIIHSERHPISIKIISKNSLHVLNRLHQSGFAAYLVGGSVRDLLLGLKPKDFDIATDAHPEQIRKLFRNSRIIGKRFRLIHVFFGRENIEVATFRSDHPEGAHPDAHQSETGMLLRDNVYGSMEDDAWRRDFSVNSLYFNIADHSVVDYTGGMQDLEKRLIRVLGEPVARFKEDPVRMLRALRFAAKLNFNIDPNTEKNIILLKELILHVSPARLFDEILKLFYCGHAANAFHLLRHYGYFELLFPETEKTLADDSEHREQFLFLILQSCHNTDLRIAQNKSLNPAFLFAILLWPPLQIKLKHYLSEGYRTYEALHKAMHHLVRKQLNHTAIPKRFVGIMQEVWAMQHPLQHFSKRRVTSLFAHPRFRAAYDFLLLRCEAGEKELQATVDWWQNFQDATPEMRLELIEQINKPKPKKPKKKKTISTRKKSTIKTIEDKGV